MNRDESSPPAAASSTQSWQRFWTIGLWVSFGLVLAHQICASMLSVSPFNGGLADGPLQLYNWLRRMDAGQVPGRDFNVFHGIGIPYLHYPLYRMLGGDLFASEISRQLICRLSTLATYLLVSRMFTKQYTLGIIWCLTTVIPQVELSLGRFQTVLHFVFTNVFNAYEPGTSMYGLRGLIPLIFVGTCNLESRPKVLLLQILLLSVNFFLSIEHGMALYLGGSGLLFVLAFLSLKNPVLRPLAKQYAMVLVGSGLLTLMLIFLNCGTEGTANYFDFHFKSQVQDQTWYFGAPPVYFLLDGLRSTKLMTIFLGLIVLASMTYIFLLAAKMRHVHDVGAARPLATRILGFAYGTISLASLLGIMAGPGAAGFNRIVYLFGSLAIQRRVTNLALSKKAWQVLNLILVVIIALQLIQCIRQASAISAPHYSEPIEQYLDQAAPIFAAQTQTKQPNLLWSTYSGLYEAKAGILHPTKCDYIIHALGPDRQDYFKKFQEYQPLYVTTCRNDKDIFEEWIRSTMFPFYRTLLFNYTIVAETPYTLIWKHVPPGEVAAQADKPVELQPVGPLRYQVPAVGKDEELALLVIDVEYQVHNPWRWLPLIGNSPRYLVHITGAKAGYDVSLPPHLNQHSFSVIPKPGEEFSLEFLVRGIRWDAAIDVKSVKVTKVTLDSANRLFLKPSTAYEQALNKLK